MDKKTEDTFRKEFEKHLKQQYIRGFSEGSKTFCLHILALCQEENPIEKIEAFINTALGVKQGGEKPES